MPTIGSLCVYCGSSEGLDGRYHDAAGALGRELASRQIGLVYGGGRVGLMGVLADAVLAGGGQVTGVIPRHLQKIEVGHEDVSELIVVASMHERKQRMAELSDGFAILPGGLGTLDEAFEIITWKQLGLHDKPIVFADIAGYWHPLKALVESVVAGGFARPAAAQLFDFVTRIEDILPALEAAPPSRTRSEPELM